MPRIPTQHVFNGKGEIETVEYVADRGQDSRKQVTAERRCGTSNHFSTYQPFCWRSHRICLVW